MSSVILIAIMLVSVIVMFVFVAHYNNHKYDVMVADDWMIGHKYFSNYEEAKEDAIKKSYIWNYCMLKDAKGNVLMNLCSGEYNERV